MAGEYGEPWEVDLDRLLDNAACASQERNLLVDDDGHETALREAVRMNVAEPLAKKLAAVKAVVEAAREYQQIMRADQSCGNGRPDFLRLIELLHKTDKALAALEEK